MPLPAIAIGAGLGLAGSLFGGNKGPSQDVMTGFAPHIQRQINPAAIGALQHGLGAVDPFQFFNPFIPQQIEALRAEANAFLPRAMGQIAGNATLQGAGGGTREAAFQGAAAGNIGRGLLSNIANLQLGGFQNAAQLAQADALRRGQLGFSALPQMQGTQQFGAPPNPFLGFLGGASIGAGF